jgi:outer membrane receptor protein involved in Fe transport
LTAGVRVADVKYQAVQVVSGLLNSGVPPVASGASRETTVTPKIGASFQYDKNNLFYFSIAKGYRVSGVNTPLADYCNVTTPTLKTSKIWEDDTGIASSTTVGMAAPAEHLVSFVRDSIC